MICHFLLRRQRLCFAVARIFVRGLTYPEAVRESTRRMFRYSLPLVVLCFRTTHKRRIGEKDPSAEAHGACVGVNVFPMSSFLSALGLCPSIYYI